MDVAHLRQLLSEVRFAADMTDAELDRLAAICALVTLAPGEVLFREGELRSEAYLIHAGRIELCMTVPARGCLPILTLEAGDLVGWSAVFDQEMTATAIAREETRLLALAAGPLRDACRQDHDLGYAVMHRLAGALSRRLLATRLQLLDLFADVPPRRIET